MAVLSTYRLSNFEANLTGKYGEDSNEYGPSLTGSRHSGCCGSGLVTMGFPGPVMPAG